MKNASLDRFGKFKVDNELVKCPFFNDTAIIKISNEKEYCGDWCPWFKIVGSDIHVCGNNVCVNFKDERIKSNEGYVPFDNLDDILDKRVRPKSDRYPDNIFVFDYHDAQSVKSEKDYLRIFNELIFEDGSPCGRRK